MTSAKLATIGQIVADQDLQDRVMAAAVTEGVRDTAYFVSTYSWHVAAQPGVSGPYQYALDMESYPGAHGRIGYDPAVVTDAAITEAVHTVAQLFGVECVDGGECPTSGGEAEGEAAPEGVDG